MVQFILKGLLLSLYVSILTESDRATVFVSNITTHIYVNMVKLAYMYSIYTIYNAYACH